MGDKQNRHHYIPQMIIRNFTLERGDKFIWTNDARRMVCFRKSIRLTASIRGLNDWHVGRGSGLQGSSESMHGLIEGAFQPVMAKIIETQSMPLDPKSRDKMITFYDALVMRSLPSRSRMFDAIMEHPEEFDPGGDDFLQHVQGVIACSSLGSERSREDFRKWHWFLVIDPSASFYLIDACNLTVKVGNPLSAPGIFLPGKTAMIMFPLSRSLMIVAFEDKPEKPLINSLFEDIRGRPSTFIAKKQFLDNYKIYSNKRRLRYSYTAKPRIGYKVIDNDRHEEHLRDFPTFRRLGETPHFALPSGEDVNIKMLLTRHKLLPV